MLTNIEIITEGIKEHLQTELTHLHIDDIDNTSFKGNAVTGLNILKPNDEPNTYTRIGNIYFYSNIVCVLYNGIICDRFDYADPELIDKLVIATRLLPLPL